MQARRLPAARGAWWLLEGFRLFRRNPPLITALTLIYLLVVQGIAALLPGIGPVILPLVLPVLTLIVANGCRLVDQGLLPDKAQLLNGIIGNGIAMFRLGGLQLLGALLLVLLNLVLNGGSDPLTGIEAAAPNMGQASEADRQAEMELLGDLMRLMLLATPLIIAFWFAPFLTGWDRVTPFKALFFSTVASGRNWRALGMFSLAAIVVAGVIPGFILIVASQIAGASLGAAFVAMRMILIFLVAPVLTASIYISYRDIFHTGIDTNA